jgi:hypothetical protein
MDTRYCFEASKNIHVSWYTFSLLHIFPPLACPTEISLTLAASTFTQDSEYFSYFFCQYPRGTNLIGYIGKHAPFTKQSKWHGIGCLAIKLK